VPFRHGGPGQRGIIPGPSAWSAEGAAQRGPENSVGGRRAPEDDGVGFPVAEVYGKSVSGVGPGGLIWVAGYQLSAYLRPMTRAESVPKGTTVVVVRHAPAEERDPTRWEDDDKRPLTPEGIAQMRPAAIGLAKVVKPVHRLASSSALRALETAVVIQSNLRPMPQLERWPELLPGRMAAPLFAKVSAVARVEPGVIIVGHDPTLSEFVGLAITGEDFQSVELAKGGAACLEFPAAVKPGAGRLRWLLTREQLAGASRRSRSKTPRSRLPT